MSKKVIEIRRGMAALLLALALSGGCILGIGGLSWMGRTVLGASKAPVTTVHESSPANLGGFANGFASVVKPALPAVVNISSSKVVKSSGNIPGFFSNDPMLRQFFNDPFGQTMNPRSERENSLGSGVIVSPDGYILTNNHVVSGASDVQVFLNDNRKFTAKVVGTDPKTDVALLKINATGLPTLPLADSSRLQVGDIVLAIGDPFGIGETVTMGIVSATGRGNLNIEPGGYEDFIQTDAAINPGNSGGALINVHGECVGINTAILSNGGGGNQGVGFAIPIGIAHGVMDQLREHGRVVRGYLGIGIQEVTPDLARAFGLSQGGGALVGDVQPDSPAARAGIASGDVILAMDGQPINNYNELRMRVSQTAPGTEIKLKIFRQGTTHEVSAKLGELSEKGVETARSEGNGAPLDGVQVQTLTPEIAGQLNLPAQAHGVVVTSVDPASRAAEAGLARGDVIQEVNRKPVTSVSEFERALTASGKQSVLMLINRGGSRIFLVVEPR
jgi:serine protease Do